MGDILTFNCEPARSRYTRYRLDPVFDRTPDGAVIGLICYHIYLEGRFVGSRRTRAQCHNLLDKLMPPAAGPECAGATIHVLAPRQVRHPCRRLNDPLRLS
jgi:hypothetical protein